MLENMGMKHAVTQGRIGATWLTVLEMIYKILEISMQELMMGIVGMHPDSWGMS